MTDRAGESGWARHRVDALDGAGVAKVVREISEGDDRRWLVVRSGRLGRVTAIPAADAVEGLGCVWVPYRRDLIRSAPKVDARAELDADAERRLREHYGSVSGV